MGDVNFYLKKPVKSTGKSLIFLKFKYNGNNALVYAFGQSGKGENQMKLRRKTEKAFLKYIKVSKLDAAKRLNAYMKNKWEEKRIKANKTSFVGCMMPDIRFKKENYELYYS